MIRVFISYAWEDEEFKSRIWDFAGWLQQSSGGKIEVIFDQLFANRPPLKGWDVWMEEEIEKASIVLIVCTPKYIKRFTKQDDGEIGGAGVTFEGAIVTQELKDCKLRNDKFFPIIPDNGSIENVPKILKPFFNGHSFPSTNESILKMILNDNPQLPNFSENQIKAAIEIGNYGLKLEHSIIKEIKEEISNSNMLSPLQILIRAYLSLSEVDKLSIANSLNLTGHDYWDKSISERDRDILKSVSEKQLLSNLWEEINKIKPFENNQNPFK